MIVVLMIRQKMVKIECEKETSPRNAETKCIMMKGLFCRCNNCEGGRFAGGVQPRHRAMPPNPS